MNARRVDADNELESTCVPTCHVSDRDTAAGVVALMRSSGCSVRLVCGSRTPRL